METVEQLRPIFQDVRNPDGSAINWTDAALRKVAELRQQARTDHFFLGNRLLGFDFFEDVHRALFDAMLQKDPAKPLHAQDSIKRRLVLWARGHYKTSAEVVEIVQLILCWPNITVLIVSGKQDLAQEILGMAKDAFENNERLAELFPEFCGKKLGTQSRFSVPNRKVSGKVRGGTVNISTAKSTKSGIHADVIFADDLVHDTNYQTPALIEQTKKVYFSFSGPILKDGGFLYILGTRYVVTDLYGTILENMTERFTKPLQPVKQYRITERWSEPNQVSHDGNWLVSIRSCWKKFPDGTTELLFPQRLDRLGELKGFTLNSLQQIYRDSPELFACHYENRPVAGGEKSFSEELFDSCAALEANIPQRGTTVIVWDLASSQSKKADLSVGYVARVGVRGKVSVIDCVADRFDPDRLVKTIIVLHAKWHAHITYLEASPGAEWLANSIINYCKLVGIEPINLGFIPTSNVKGIKDIRIMALVPLMTAGRINFFAGMLEYDNIKEAFLRYPSGHDDYPDGVSLLMEVLPMIDPTPSRMEQELKRQQQEEVTQLEPNPFGGIGGISEG